MTKFLPLIFFIFLSKVLVAFTGTELQILGALPSLDRPLHSFVSSQNSQISCCSAGTPDNASIVDGTPISKQFVKMMSAEPSVLDIPSKQLLAFPNGKLTVFFDSRIVKPSLMFQQDCRTERYLFSVSQEITGLVQNGTLSGQNAFYEEPFLNFDSFDTYEITTPPNHKACFDYSLPAGFNQVRLTYLVSVVFKVKHWRLASHQLCFNCGEGICCKNIQTCDYYDTSVHPYSQQSSDELFVKTVKGSYSGSAFLDVVGDDNSYSTLLLNFSTDSYLSLRLSLGDSSYSYNGAKYPILVRGNYNFTQIAVIPESIAGYDSIQEKLSSSNSSGVFAYLSLPFHKDYAVNQLSIQTPFTYGEIKVRTIPLTQTHFFMNSSKNSARKGEKVNLTIVLLDSYNNPVVGKAFNLTIANYTLSLTSSVSPIIIPVQLNGSNIPVSVFFLTDGEYSSASSFLFLQAINSKQDLFLYYSGFALMLLFLSVGFASVFGKHFGSLTSKALSLIACLLFFCALYYEVLP